MEPAQHSEELQRLLVESCSSTSAASDQQLLVVANRTPVSSQVVVLKVALHCQGCARRVKKAVSKLHGVDSYHVDLDNEKVTVVGKVNPKLVLERVAKIKAAQFWPNPNRIGPISC